MWKNLYVLFRRSKVLRETSEGVKEIIFLDFGILYQKKLDLISFFGTSFFIYYY